MVLKRLRDVGLQYNIKKYKFHATEVMYLGLIISYNEIKMDSTVIINWESLINI